MQVAIHIQQEDIKAYDNSPKKCLKIPNGTSPNALSRRKADNIMATKRTSHYLQNTAQKTTKRYERHKKQGELG